MEFKKVAQITDIHLDKKEFMPFKTDGMDSLICTLENIKSHGIEFLFITGDICLDSPRLEIYEWLKKILNKFNFLYTIIPGNHDDVSMINQVFDLGHRFKNDQIYYSIPTKKFNLIFLDTSTFLLTPEQQNWVKVELSESKKPVVIIMHHPPTLLDINFMDSTFPLQNIDEVQSIFQAYKKELTIFCGHYHFEKTVVYKNQTIHLTPSTLFQIDDKSADFKVYNTIPGWRLIEFKGDKISTVVKYVDLL